MSNPFDSHARTWDADAGRRRMADGILSAVRRRIPIRSNWTVLDYGAGTGLVSLALATVVRHVTAVDSSPGMLDVLAEKARTEGISNLETRRSDFQTDPPPSGPFQLVTSAMTLHHVRDLDTVLAVFFRLLAPGGYLAVADLDAEDGSFHGTAQQVEHYGFERDSFAHRLAAAGFENMDVTTAVRVEKNNRTYPVFLATARRP